VNRKYPSLKNKLYAYNVNFLCNGPPVARKGKMRLGLKGEQTLARKMKT
jgi:hypothetical protein